MRLPSRLAAQMKPSYLFYDLETTGLNPSFDQILQFAAVRLDLAFNEIERFNIRVALSSDVIPNPVALLVNRTHPSQLSDGIDEYQAIKMIHEIMNQPGTISLGYNTLGFDDEFLRFAFFRHLLPVYTHQYANGCYRMDIFPMVLFAHHFYPDLLRWPVINKKASFKLEHLIRENNLNVGQSHDALVDVLDTIALAKILKANATCWERVTVFFDKTRVAEATLLPSVECQIGNAKFRLGFMMEAQPSLPIMSVLHLGNHEIYKNQSRWLRLDKASFNELPHDTFMQSLSVQRKKECEPPFLFAYSDPLCLAKCDETTRALVEKNKQWLIARPDVFFAIQQHFLAAEYASHDAYDANAALYKISFPTPVEESLFRKFHLINPNRKLEVLLAFPNSVHQILAIRLMGRHMPEALSDRERENYNQYINYVFSMNPADALIDYREEKKLTISAALSEVEKLLITKTEPHEQAMLQALKTWYERAPSLRCVKRETLVGTDRFFQSEEAAASVTAVTEVQNTASF